MTDITSKIRNRLTSRIVNDKVACITGTERFSKTKCFDELANTVGVAGIIGTDRFTNNSWFDKLANTTDLTNITFGCII